MQERTNAEEHDRAKKSWTSPHVTVYGAMKDLTQKLGPNPEGGGSFTVVGPGAPPG